MQFFFKKLSEEFKITSLFVTHDLKEAVLMGDEIGLMKEGRLQVYKDKNEFITDPETGVLDEIEFWDKLMPKEKFKG
jgi:ABC-type proline/glycine betaine transport system ATPase subunit